MRIAQFAALLALAFALVPLALAQTDALTPEQREAFEVYQAEQDRREVMDLIERRCDLDAARDGVSSPQRKSLNCQLAQLDAWSTLDEQLVDDNTTAIAEACWGLTPTDFVKVLECYQHTTGAQ